MQKNKTYHDEMRSSQSTIVRRYDKRYKEYSLSTRNYAKISKSKMIIVIKT